MKEVHIRFSDEKHPASGPGWRAELWTGHPSEAGSQKLAGGDDFYSQAQFESDMEVEGTAYKLSLKEIQEKFAGNDTPDPIFGMIGLRLYEMLAACGVTGALEQETDAADRGQSELRTYLVFPQGSILSAWPWELLARPQKRHLQVIPRHLFIHPRFPIVRASSGFPKEDAPYAPVPVVRILLAAGTEDLDGTKTFTASHEFRKIRKAFHVSGLSVLISRINPESVAEFTKAIEELRPHILHFLGHCQQIGNDYALMLGVPGKWVPWTSSGIHQYFGQLALSSKPRLVTLNACSTNNFQLAIGPLADAFVDGGVKAVVSAQAPVRFDYAQSFAEAFYGTLADPNNLIQIRPLGSDATPDLDLAMTKVRERLIAMDALNGVRRRHWAAPVLQVRAPVESILRIPKAHIPVTLCEGVKELFTRPGRFVNRSADRWKILRQFHPASPKDRRYRGVIIDGQPQMGKSWLVKRTIRDFLDCGFIVRYAELPNAGKEKRTSLDILEDWRGEPGAASFLRNEIRQGLFKEFDRSLAAARQTPNAELIQQVYRSFLDDLQTARIEGNTRRNVLLIIGKFTDGSSPTVQPPDFREGLLNNILLRINNEDPETEGLLALLITRENVLHGREYDNYGLATLSAFSTLTTAFQESPPSRFPDLDKTDMWDEFSDFDERERVQLLGQFVRTVPIEEVTPVFFKGLDTMVTAAKS